MKTKLAALAVLALAFSVKAQGQTTVNLITAPCTAAKACANVSSTDGHYSLSFAGTNVSVVKDGELDFTASNLVTGGGVAGTGDNPYYDTTYLVTGTFTGGSFRVYVEETTVITGTGAHRRTTHYYTLLTTFNGTPSTLTLN